MGFTFSTYEQAETEWDRKAAQARVADLTARAFAAEDRLLALGSKHVNAKDTAATMRCSNGIRKLAELISMLGEIKRNPKALDHLVAFGYASAQEVVWTTPKAPERRPSLAGNRHNRFAKTARGWH